MKSHIIKYLLAAILLLLQWSGVAKSLNPTATDHVLPTSFSSGQGATATNITVPVKSGDNAENPIDFGVITEPLHKTVNYDTDTFTDCHSGQYSSGRKDVFLKFTFLQDVEFAVSPFDTAVGGACVTLLDSSKKTLQQITTNVYPNTSLYKSRLPKGTYFVVLEGAGSDGVLGAGIRILPLDALSDNRWRPSTDKNYVATMKPTYETSVAGYVSPGLSDTKIAYFDELGRPVETKQYAASPNGKDLVACQDYNVYGFTSRSYLPVEMGENGEYVAANKVSGQAATFYNDSNPFKSIEYEASPLARIREQYGAGRIWHEKGKAIRNEYDLNTDSIARFFTGGTRANPKLMRREGYAVKTLYVVTVIDEDGNEVQKFTDRNGRNILSRVQNGDEKFDTYYVYDDYENLCFVLPPMIRPDNVSADELNKYAYMYRYDYRNRCTGKKIPGAEWSYYVYDFADNPVLTQDGESRSRGAWNCTLYDEFKRPVISGIYTGKVDRHAVCDMILSAKYDGTGPYGYSFGNLQPDSLRVLTVTYYDNYAFKELLSASFPEPDFVEDPDYGAWHNHASYSAKGLMTGSVTSVLDESARIYSVTYYDDCKRPVQVRSTTASGGLRVEKNRYNFTGNVIQSCECVRPAEGMSEDIVLRKNNYDKTGRLLSVETTLNGCSPAKISYEYDATGRLSAMVQGEGDQAIRTVKTYNIRSWLTALSNDLFSMSLKYHDPLHATPSYTGNITEWHWKHGVDAEENTYAFTYDGLSRLLDSRQYTDGTLTDTNVERGLSYDKHGNILSLQRFSSGRAEHLYSYSYQGNQLEKVVDASDNTANRIAVSIPDKFEPLHPSEPGIPVDPGPLKPIDPDRPVDPIFPDRPWIPIDPDRPVGPILPDRPWIPIDTDWEMRPLHVYDALPADRVLSCIPQDSVYTGSTYRYDYNGNMVYDALRNRNMRYNGLNLIKKVFDAQSLFANYRYLADGTKLSVTDADGNGFVYHGSLVYRKQGDDLKLESVAVDGGRIIATHTSSGVSYFPRYFLTDHLGSTRAVVDGKTASVLSYDYYPFGKKWTSSDTQVSDNRYLYNGKEWQPTGNVNLLDYGARMYDQELGLWHNPDPESALRASISPYIFCSNSPMNRLDLDGKWDVTVHFYKDRAASGFRGVSVVTDRLGNEIFRFNVRGEGTGGRNRYLTNADTPLGVYDIPDNAWKTGGDRRSYGPNPRLIMNGISGEIFETGRDAIRMHGGRQEDYNTETGNWVKNKNARLKVTRGCIRVSDEDMLLFKQLTDALMDKDLFEKPGIVTVLDDLEKFEMNKKDKTKKQKARAREPEVDIMQEEAPMPDYRAHFEQMVRNQSHLMFQIGSNF